MPSQKKVVLECILVKTQILGAQIYDLLGMGNQGFCGCSSKNGLMSGSSKGSEIFC